MNLSHKMFILAVEEMNFTKAAHRAFVTQQCLSLHIKKLETEYGIKLFERKPRLQLTPAGESLYHSLCQLQIAESSIVEKLSDIKEGRRGEIIFGINATRAKVLIPNIVSVYQENFPLVKISLILDDMRNLVPLLLNGKIDMFLGVDCIYNKNFNVLPLIRDEVFFIAKASVLEKFAINKQVYEETMRSHEIDLLNFPNLPFIGNYTGSSTNNLIERYLDMRRVRRDVLFSVSDYEIQIEACAFCSMVAFCPNMVLEKVFEQNAKKTTKFPLHIFRFKGLQDSLHIDLISHKNSYQTSFHKEFIRMLQQQILMQEFLTARLLESCWKNKDKQMT